MSECSARGAKVFGCQSVASVKKRNEHGVLKAATKTDQGMLRCSSVRVSRQVFECQCVASRTQKRRTRSIKMPDDMNPKEKNTKYQDARCQSITNTRRKRRTRSIKMPDVRVSRVLDVR